MSMDYFKLGDLKLKANEAVIVGDPCYFDDTPHGCHTLELGWAANKYPVFLATKEGRPLALILSRYPFAPTIATFQSEPPLLSLAVDSGQMAMIAASVFPVWRENDRCDFDHPQCDYDYACRATLMSQLGADFLANRSERTERHPSAQVGTAVCSGTCYGDGQYPLVVLREEDDITAVAVLFDGWSDEDEDFDEDWAWADEETEPDGYDVEPSR